MKEEKKLKKSLMTCMLPSSVFGPQKNLKDKLKQSLITMKSSL
jgi:hypothetical protein